MEYEYWLSWYVVVMFLALMNDARIEPSLTRLIYQLPSLSAPREAIIITKAESLQNRLGGLACTESDAIFAVAVAQWLGPRIPLGLSAVDIYSQPG